MVWPQSKMLYFTDPGALGAAVDHAAADALVAAAAAVWNVPQASITVAQGGGLAEHVSSANVYLGTDGLVYPADVGSGNSAAVPVAVVYDTDGSVTDLLLGVGASSPSSCRQNGVTESVDQFDPAGYIRHAIVVVNGRCSGAAPEMQMQLRYQMERVFGRVLGLAWSQANDNVFTGTPQPTYDQAMHWPILHPLDIICGPYTYQCFPSPFQLRPDDVAGLVLLYPNAVGSTPPAGKVVSLGQAEGVFGEVDFPTGQGMAGVNVLVQRQGAQSGVREGWVEASGVTGTFYRRNGTSPFVVKDTSSQGSEGSNDAGNEGKYYVAYLPLQDGATEQTVVVSTEAVNALYVGTHSVEPYAAGAVTPSGSAPAPVVFPQATNNGDTYAFFTVADAASSCGTGLDGTAGTPVQAPASGFGSGLICGYGHAAYSSLNVQANRTLTVEVTGVDEQGYGTTGKLMPAIGVFAPTDGVGGLPSVAVQPGAFNALGLGTTRVVAATGGLTQVKIGVADERGDGRPDFAYQERIFYADSVSPARLPTAGGTVTIAGMGFRAGNQVLVNGVNAAASGWTANAITVAVPALAVVGATDKVAVDVEVRDLSSGAVSTMLGALTYDSAGGAKGMKLVSAPASGGSVGTAEAMGFGVQVVAADGVTGVSGETVVFSAAAGGGAGLFSVCPAAMCSVMTDSNGIAMTGVTPLMAGTTTLVATDGSLSETVSFGASAADAAMTVVSTPSGGVANGVAVTIPFTVKVLGANGTGQGGRLVTFTVTQGAAIFGGCAAATCAVTTRADGTASVTVTPTAVGTVTLTATDGGLRQSVSFTSQDSTDLMQVATPLAAMALTGQQDGFGILLLHADGVSPDAGEQVVFSVSGGATLNPCGTATCAQTTRANGLAGVAVFSQQPGTFTVEASFGEVVQTATVTFRVGMSQMILLGSPANGQTVGQVTNQPLRVQLLYPDGSPIGGALVAVAGALNQVRLGCGLGACLALTDGNGIATEAVTPLQAGLILLTAQYGILGQQAMFTAIGTSDTMTVLTSPAAGTLTGDAESFAVQVILPDGMTPAAGDTVVFSVTKGTFAFDGCAGTTCSVTTDAHGKAAVTGKALAAGMVTLKAADGAVSQAVSFSTTAPTDVLVLKSAPVGPVFVGVAAVTPFAVQVFQTDGVTPAVGRKITFAVTVGSAKFSACAVAPCTVTSDVNGLAPVTLTALAAGQVSVVAADGAASQAVTVTAIPPPDLLQAVSAPSGSVFVAVATATAFKVKVTLADGVTPVSGFAVTFANGGAGQVSFDACGKVVCVVLTDATGVAATGVVGLLPGAVSLVASAVLGGVTQSLDGAVMVVADEESLVAVNPTTWIAEGAAVTTTLAVTAGYNGGLGVGLPVSWSGTGAVSLAGDTSVTDGLGAATLGVTLGPLAGGAGASVRACAWVAVCAEFTASGVSQEVLQVEILSGGEQTAASADALRAVVAKVTDGEGNAVVGAGVTTYQTVNAGAMCPALGRCPAMPVVAFGSSVAVSDAMGQVTVQPTTAADGATETRMLLTVGMHGSATADAWVHPVDP